MSCKKKEIKNTFTIFDKTKFLAVRDIVFVRIFFFFLFSEPMPYFPPGFRPYMLSPTGFPFLTAGFAGVAGTQLRADILCALNTYSEQHCVSSPSGFSKEEWIHPSVLNLLSDGHIKPGHHRGVRPDRCKISNEFTVSRIPPTYAVVSVGPLLGSIRHLDLCFIDLPVSGEISDD